MIRVRRNDIKKIKAILSVLPILALFSVICLSQKIYAYNQDEHYSTEIKYYEPEGCNSDGGGTSTHLAGGDIPEKVWNYLISKGFNDAQAAGIMGNFYIESGLNPVCEVDNNCWGIAMICQSSGQYAASRQAFQDAGYGQFMGHPTEYSPWGAGDKLPEEHIDGLLSMAIDWILKICDENRHIRREYTYTEWLKTAQTPEEAAEIFTITYERPVCNYGWNPAGGANRCYKPEHVGNDYDTSYYGYQDLIKRVEKAREYYDLYAGNGTSSNSTSSSLGAGDGGNVTIIGDSITNMSSARDGEGIKKYLPNADIRSQGSKHMFMNAGPSNGGDSGAKILEDIVNKNELRDVLIIALGTNDPGALTQSQLQSDIVNRAINQGGATKVIFVNNAEVSIPGIDASKYVQNNQVFRDLANANPNVDVADWAAIIADNPGLLNPNDVHPNLQGQDAYGKLMYDAVGALNGSSSGKSSNCNCSKGNNTGSIQGGLSEEQAQKLADDYNNGPIDRWWTGDRTYDILDNCVSFSKYIIRYNTDDIVWGGGNGGVVVNNLIANNPGFEHGTEPRAFSIFSVANHTGFVAAVNGDDVITVEAGWKQFIGTVKHRKKADMSNGAFKFFYIDGHLNDNFMNAVGASSSISTTSSESAALVSASWKDGWITQGIEGYKKEPYQGVVTPIDNSMNGSYLTKSPKNGAVGPNKITLHSVEGRNENSGLAVYNSSSAALSHFTIDLKNKKVYQHLPIDRPACGVARHDDTAGVQIEIMGFSTTSSNGFDNDWYLQNNNAFGDSEWAYLAKLLVAISDETGIPLTSDVQWNGPVRLDGQAFYEYEGVLGHMNVPDNDHTDPGNIWGKLSTQLGKIQSGKTDGTCGDADGATWEGNFPFLFQCESKWTGSTFAGGTFCNAGCGPTSMAMVVSAITGNLVTPTELTGKLDCDTTSNRDCLLRWADLYDIEGVNFAAQMKLNKNSSTEEIKQAFEKYLRDGYIVITSGNSSNSEFSNAERNPFSSSGHYVVFYGIDENGNWLIADPGGRNRNWAGQCTDIGQCEAHDNGMVPEDIIKAGIQRKDGTGVVGYAFKKK